LAQGCISSPGTRPSLSELHSAMFLSKDFLQNDLLGKGMDPPGSATTSESWATNSGQRTLTSSMRPTSATTRSYTPFTGGEEEGEEQPTPTSAANIRQKMLQQRQRTLQKLSTGPSTPGGSMVMATASPTMTGGPGAVSSNDRQPFAEHSRLITPTHRGMSAKFDRSDSMNSNATDMSDHGLVIPEPSATKEEETRRRNNLAQDLDERGICPVFDPTGGPVGVDGLRGFDVDSLITADVKGFLLNPAPKQAGMLECRIIRERNGLNKLYPKYTLETDSGTFLMTAKKQKHNKTSNYNICASKTENSKDSDTWLGKLRSNFLGLEFVAFGTGLNPKKIDMSMGAAHALQLARQELCGIQYSSSLWGGTKPRGPRKMTAVIPRVQRGERLICRTLTPESEGLVALQRSGTANHLIDTFVNKPPKWNEQIGAFVLNFNKRVTQASVKNFQLTSTDDPDTVYLQFGRVGRDVFNVDFRYPFSPYQAFAICLSSFDYKLCCE